MRRVVLAIAVLAAACMLAVQPACLRQHEAALSVGTIVWSGYEWLYLARSLGYYDGKPIRLVEYSSQFEVERAYLNGVIDVMATSGNGAIQLFAKGHEANVFLVMDISRGADSIIAHSDIKSVADLRGKKVGIGAGSNALSAYMISRALELNGMEPKDVVLVTMHLQEQERAFTERKIDAVVSFEPFRSRLLAKGGREIFDSTQLPTEIVDVLLTRKATFESQERALRELLEGWFRARDYAAANPLDAAGRVAPRERLAPDLFLSNLKLIEIPDLNRNKELLSGRDPSLSQALSRMATFTERNKLIERAVDTSKLLDDRIVKLIAR